MCATTMLYDPAHDGGAGTPQFEDTKLASIHVPTLVVVGRQTS